MNNEKFEITGMEELVRQLNGLEPFVAQTILQDYLKATSNKFIVSSLKSGLNYSGYTESQIKVSRDKIKQLAFFSGPTTDAFWLRFTDKGTAVRKTKKGANRGFITGKHQIPGIVNSQIQLIIDDAENELGRAIDDYLKKNNNTK